MCGTVWESAFVFDSNPALGDLSFGQYRRVSGGTGSDSRQCLARFWNLLGSKLHCIWCLLTVPYVETPLQLFESCLVVWLFLRMVAIL